MNPGPSAPVDQASAFAATQAAWRFLHNDRITLPQLMTPLHEVARQWRQEQSTRWALIIHDWSALSYPTHLSKRDSKSHGSEYSRGYDLGTLLLVDGAAGDPVAPVAMELRTADAIYSSRVEPVSTQDSRLDTIRQSMQSLDGVLGRERVVHIIDREADSLPHFRDWQADQRCFLVRARDSRRVRWHGNNVNLASIPQQLQTQNQFRRVGEVRCRTQIAVQSVAETNIVLDRPGWRTRGGRRERVNQRRPGDSLTLRLVISRICDSNGDLITQWLLLTNAPNEVNAETLAQWYYWRWRIESFFKLLKSAGQAVEQWQQETGAAIAKRLLVAAMACALVWKLERVTSPDAIRFRTLLVRLSGRQMKYGKTFTAPALLSGLWVYLAMLDALDQHTIADLQAMKQHLRLLTTDTG